MLLAILTTAVLSQGAPARAVELASAMLCGDQELAAGALKSILDEQRSARHGGGVVSLSDIHDAQDTIRWAEHHAAWVKHWLRVRSLKARACTAPEVKALRDCLSYIQSPPSISWLGEPTREECKGLTDELRRGELMEQ